MTDTTEIPKRKLFGTDGVRGKANSGLTAEIALKLGQAAGRKFMTGRRERHLVLVGKDTRLSGYMLEDALVAGLLSAGMDVKQLGPIPTPAVAMLTRSMRANLGVMISASHNPYEDNGIKLFGPDGLKLSDATEAEIEQLMESGCDNLPTGAGIGRAQRIDGVGDRYVELAKQTFLQGRRLDGLRVVIDCANGAAYQVAPKVLGELGARVFEIGVNPNGTNINDGCGSMHPEALIRKVEETGSHIGIALDGDADRVLIVDEQGRQIDGDQLLAVIADDWGAERIGGKVVGTMMSNLAFEKYLKTKDIELVRAKVGDRYVLEQMQKHNCILGGEASGHIIMSEYVTTGDGLIAALQLLAVVIKRGWPVSEVAHLYDPFPQVMRNVAVDKSRLEDERVKAAVTAAETRLENAGARLVVRPSGTEPVVRLMAEGEDRALLVSVVDELDEVLRQ